MNPTHEFQDLQTRFLHAAAPSIAPRMVKIDGHVANIQVLEGGRGAPLLLLHGGGGAAVMWAPILEAQPERVAADLYELARLNFVLPGGRRAWLSMLETFTTLRGVDPRWYNRERLLGIKAPTLFIWGEDDAFAPPSSGTDLARRM